MVSVPGIPAYEDPDLVEPNADTNPEEHSADTDIAIGFPGNSHRNIIQMCNPGKLTFNIKCEIIVTQFDKIAEIALQKNRFLEELQMYYVPREFW